MPSQNKTCTLHEHTNHGAATIICFVNCAKTAFISRIVRSCILPQLRIDQLMRTYSSSLKYACPHGVFMSLTPGDPTLWSGVLFVRKGAYAPSILRFQVSFPPQYPALPPLITFSTDIFHPLITPLTTYMYSTDAQGDDDTVSATDEERLPPGGFSLRDGFPEWFGRKSKSMRSREEHQRTPTRAGMGSPSSGISSIGKTSDGVRVGVYEILRYVRRTFDDETVLDRVPLEAAGNPGAWHAWRAYRVKLGKLARQAQQGERPLSPVVARKPGEWNWDGVWEVRVKKGVEASISEAVLYGQGAGDDLIQFLNVDADRLEEMRRLIRESSEAVDPGRRSVGA
ncbi:ubiquitin-conjugating enzyme protein [Rutstroemia sp. NJR-2017a BVV2]|nr:ubiquitin-conjugating enzyme protein [Rutstroemia sp. NJR-2017a BVV2]